MAKPRLDTGSTLDGFLIGEKIHQGGMAEIWEVTKEGIDTPLVMKVPLILDGDDPTMIVGFEGEQMILPRLSGPHVPRCLGLGDFSVQPYIVMERIEGESLLKRFKEAPIPVAEVIDLGAKIATALASLHRQDVIHLDLKPSNIMFRPSGEAVFIDFGLSRHLKLPDLLAEEFRVPMGTAPYIAPEQVLKLREEPRSDLFALGVLMYTLVTGERPFGNPKHTTKALLRRLYEAPTPPRLIRKDIPDPAPGSAEAILDEADAAVTDPLAKRVLAAQRASFHADLGRPEAAVQTADTALSGPLPDEDVALAAWAKAGAI